MTAPSPARPRARRDAWLEEPSPPAVGRARARLVLLLLLVGLWRAPWLGAATGADRTGAVGALALLAAWGMGGTVLLARTGRGIRRGEAATSALLAGVLALLVAVRHPWLPGPDHRATWLPVSGGLVALAALDLLALGRRLPTGVAIPAIRTVAALAAAVAWTLGRHGLPAGVAAWLFVAPASTGFVVGARDARRAAEVLGLVAAVAVFLAPELAQALVPSGPSVEVPTFWAFLHRLVGAALGVVALRGSLWPEGAPAGEAPPRAS